MDPLSLSLGFALTFGLSLYISQEYLFYNQSIHRFQSRRTFLSEVGNRTSAVFQDVVLFPLLFAVAFELDVEFDDKRRLPLQPDGETMQAPKHSSEYLLQPPIVPDAEQQEHRAQ